MLKISYIAVFVSLFLISGCQTNSKDQLMQTEVGQVQIRQIQTRAFDTLEREKTLRTAIATLQDLGFVIDEAEMDLGSVSATKLDGYMLRMTVVVRNRSETQLLVRANAQYNDMAVSDPIPYQKFFVALEKAMFLTAHNVD